MTKLSSAGNALIYSTYLGGSGNDWGDGITVDGAGSAYITGYTTSTNFPTQSAYQATLQGGRQNVFVTKLSPAGNALVYSTYLGGNGNDYGQGIAVDWAGSAYVTGYTSSTNFPTQSPYQPTLRGSQNAFVTKLTPAGSALAYSTYLGGSSWDLGYGIAVDGAGSAYVTGRAASTNFPTQSAYQATYQGLSDAFVTKLTPAGNALVYSTYLGGSDADEGYGIAVDGAGSAYVTGGTCSANFPTQSPYQATNQTIGFAGNAFVTKLTPAGNALSYSTYLGGSAYDVGRGIAVDGSGSAYVTGFAQSTNFPTQSAYQATNQGGQDALVTKLSPAGNTLIYSTYLGGSGYDQSNAIAVDGAGSAYVTGYTESTNFPTQSPYQATLQAGQSAFVTKLTLAGSGPGLAFFPIPPCRLVDTRVGQGKTDAFGPPGLTAFSSRDFPLFSAGCSIPSTAQAYSLNFTVVPSGPLGFLSAWPTGDSYPGVSTLNSSDGSVIANAAIVPAGTSGSITVVAANPTDLVIDINGYFAPAAASGLDFYPLTPCRMADTRTSQPFTGAFGPPSLSAWVTRDFPLAASPCLSGSEQAYSLNMTVVPQGPLGFLSTWPVGLSYPGVSTLNSPDGTALANAAIVPAGTNGDIDVVASNSTDLIIDINGMFAAPGTGGLQFYAVKPCRVADTRSSQPFTDAFGPPSLAAYSHRDFPIVLSPCGIPSSAQAYALNLTVVPQGPLGFLSTWPAGQTYPGVSTLNSSNGAVIANAAIVPAGTDGAITVVAANPTDLIIDIVGYFAP